MISGWQPGVLVGPYRLEAEIGRGGMGVVYRARHAESGAIVVLKTLTVLDPDEVARFEREGLALGRLQHPNLIRVHSAGWHERRPYLVLQFAAGGSLGDRLARGPLPWEEAVALVAPLANALAAAHAIGITHRDLKPDNVLLDEHGTPLLADFGLARIADLSRMTETGAVLGTPLYMAPEQSRGEDSGGQADVYSLAAVLFASIAGRPPIPAQPGGVVAQLIALQEQTPPRLSSLVEVPSWLDRLVAEGLARDASVRPSAAALSARLADTESQAESGSSSGLPLGLVLSGLVVLFLLLGLGLQTLASSSGPAPSEPLASLTPSATKPKPTPSQAAEPFRLQEEVHRELPKELLKLRRQALKMSRDEDDRRFLKGLGSAKEESLATAARKQYSQLLRERREAYWAALELALRGYLDWLAGACTDWLDIRQELPVATRLARSSHSGAQSRLRRIKTIPPLREAGRAYQDAYNYLSKATALNYPHSDQPVGETLGRLQAQTTRPPRHVGAAWVRVYEHEGLQPTSAPHRRARDLLGAGRPGAALALYLEAWRASSRDSEALAAELATTAEWEWSRHLRQWGHPYTEGAPVPTLERSREEVRKEMLAVVNEVEWARGYYLYALSYLKLADPRRPFPSLAAELCPQVLVLLDRALDLDRGLAPARLLRAQVRRWGGNLPGALEDLAVLAYSSPSWRETQQVLEALCLLELCKEQGVPIPPATRAAYETALEVNRQTKHAWVDQVLSPLYESLGE